jgi:signal recognition particle subunit SRP54
MSLMEDFEKVADQEQAEKDAKRLLRGSFSLDDFLNQLRTIQKMGPLRDVLAKMPMAGQLFPEGAADQVDGKELKRIEAMILSMTPQERREPERINPSREARIARGSGSDVAQLREMLERFKTMRTMMAQLGKGLGAGGMGGMLGRMPGVGKLFGGGGMPDLSGVDPAALQQALGGMGAAPNREAARAMRAEAKRKDRKQKRKHQRRGRRR